MIDKAIRNFDILRHELVILTWCGFVVGEESDVIGAVHAEQLFKSRDYANQGGKDHL